MLGFRLLDPSYSEAHAISLDYAIAEKASNMICVPLTTPWSDVASWSALWHVMEKDTLGNVTCGSGEFILDEALFAYSDGACITPRWC